MDETETLAYIKATAVLLALPLDAARAQRVALHLVRTAALARQLEEMPLRVDDEPAELYCPAPFPAAGDGVQLP